ncbi:hypothetical protein E3U36_06765 [Arsenophonus endosymbiont of Aphis craccivora]|nr:hypothetical protein E3U36_06765 [Arsenophonus endosymbiont of Aphis craccivora]
MTAVAEGAILAANSDLFNKADSGQNALFLVAEAGKYASLCLLLEPRLVLKDRVMRFCDPIKIMNNRLMIYQP